MKKFVKFLSLFILLVGAASVSAQDATSTSDLRRPFSIGASFGYDLPLFDTPYEQLEYKGNRYFSVHADYQFPSNLGIRLGYANIKTTPNILIPDQVYFDTIASPTSRYKVAINRHYLGIGPSYRLEFGQSNFSLLFAPTAGYSWVSGGDAYVESYDSIAMTNTMQLVNTGYETGAIATKIDLELDYAVTPNLSITLGAYYMRHFGVHLDDQVDINTPYISPIAHGENVYDHAINPYTVSATPPNIVPISKDEPKCMDLSSVGVNLGLRWRFGSNPKPVIKEEPVCNTCACPNDTHKVIVSVKDGPSQQVIASADVALKNMQGDIIATGTTNSFGVVDFGAIPHGNYIVTGLVHGIETTTESLVDAEFLPNTVIQKEVLYNDLRFILKGITTNRTTGGAEPNVVVSLTNDQSGSVQQDNSDGKGGFTFRLDQNANYRVVGSKENRLSEIERASTVGLTRSTTLFVNLELGVETFDCGQGAVLDIKYELDKWNLTPAATFELDRLVQYLKDHPADKVELSSHTDSRGSNKYNMDLSDKRARSAVDYIISEGISSKRIIAKGYGETRLLNRCADGVDCTEAEHTINRRTEATLLCK